MRPGRIFPLAALSLRASRASGGDSASRRAGEARQEPHSAQPQAQLPQRAARSAEARTRTQEKRRGTAAPDGHGHAWQTDGREPERDEIEKQNERA